MKYFLVIGLMMVGSFAQADICSPLWWQSATLPQVEQEAELKGPLAMNTPCPDGVMPLTLALENNNNPEVFSAIVRHFDLDEEARSQVAEYITEIYIQELNTMKIFSTDGSIILPLPTESSQGVLYYMYMDYVRAILHLQSIRDEYSEDIEVLEGIEGNPAIEIRDNSGLPLPDDVLEEYERMVLYFLSITDEYSEDIGVLEGIKGNPAIEIRDNSGLPLPDDVLEEYERMVLYFLGITNEYQEDIEVLEEIEGNPAIEIRDNR